MSLATDILKRAETIDPPKPIKKVRAPHSNTATPKRKKTKPTMARIFGRTRRPPSKDKVMPNVTHMPGVSFASRDNGWDAYYYDGQKKIRIGVFPTQARAIIARKIYMLWRKRGFSDIPNKPEKRLYTHW
jgi:hypothetical protein